MACKKCENNHVLKPVEKFDDITMAHLVVLDELMEALHLTGGTDSIDAQIYDRIRTLRHTNKK